MKAKPQMAEIDYGNGHTGRKPQSSLNENAMRHAAREGDMAELRVLLAAGTDPNAGEKGNGHENPGGTTAL